MTPIHCGRINVDGPTTNAVAVVSSGQYAANGNGQRARAGVGERESCARGVRR